MADKEKHQSQYEKNKKLLNTTVFDLNQTIYYDWIITIMFYCSLHLIEKYIGQETNKHDMKHYQRGKFVNSETFLKSIADEYNTLYSESVRARYNCEKITGEDVEFANTLLKRIEDKLVSY